MLLNESHRAWTVPLVYPGVAIFAAFGAFLGLKELGVDFQDGENNFIETILVLAAGSAAVYATDRILIKR